MPTNQMMYSIGPDGFDLSSEENLRKWRGLFINTLKQIQKITHPTLIAKPDGLNYVESLILRLLNTLITSTNTAGSNTSTSVTIHNIQDVEERIKRLFPQPLDKWAIKKAHEILALLKNYKKSKANVFFSGADKTPLKTSVDKFHSLLQKEGVLSHKAEIQVSQYILAVLEFIATDILQLSGHYVRNMTHTEITSQDIRVAMCADKVLMDLFYSDVDEVALGPPPSAGYHHHGQSLFLFDSDTIDGEYGNVGARTGVSYLEAVRELVHEEEQFIRDLNLIIKVFRDPLTSLLEPEELDRIFANIDDILEFSKNFQFSLEDAVEAPDEEECPSIGTCFEDFLEEQEFDVFDKYATDIMSFPLREHLYQLLSSPKINETLLQAIGQPMLMALRYVLPQLLLVPVFHCSSYFKAIQNFKELTSSKEDRDSFEQADALIVPLKNQLEKTRKSSRYGESLFLRLYGRTSRATASARIAEIQRSIDGWEGKDIGQWCNEFVMEGPLSKVSGLGIGHRSTRLTDRYAFVFDGLIVLCKPNTKRSSMSVTAAVTGRDTSTSSCDWRLKERFLIRNIEIIDHGDICDRNSNFYLPATGSSFTSTNPYLTGNGDLSPMSADNQSFVSLTSSVGNLSLMSNTNASNAIGINNDSTNSSSSNNNNSSACQKLRYAFEIRPRNHPTQSSQNSIILVAKSAEDKDRWMSQLILLNSRSMLERTLDSRMSEEEKKHPLQLPDPQSYRFATEDFDTNIILEENKSNPNVPLIKGATLLKLIERLTYHINGDPMLVRTFLTTYRSFCTPTELLKLLIERFEIPDPDMASCMQAMHFANEELASPTSIHPHQHHEPMLHNGHHNVEDPHYDSSSPNTGPTSPTSPTHSMASEFGHISTFTFDQNDDDMVQRDKDYRKMLNKFRIKYAQPVQCRVMNVLRQWVAHHYYDFERDPALLETLMKFLKSKNSVPRKIRKLIEHLKNKIDRKRDQSKTENIRAIIHNSVAPAIEWWIAKEETDFDLLTLHPIEVARQLTLLEFELYRAVKPSELVGVEGQSGVWTKKDKQKTSPNLLKMIRHNSSFTFYLEKCIVEAENFEERTAIMTRIIEIMMVLQELNNFNGVIEVTSALNSAAVHRLDHTKACIERNSKLKRAYDEARVLTNDHFKKYHEKLRSINPPCVPFFGTYLTNILLLEEGNPEYLSPPNHLENMSLHDTSGVLSDEAVNCKLINFGKKRKVAEITGEIQQYQNQPYCLKVEPSIRHFLENLSPLGDLSEVEFQDYLYAKSLEIEPRNSKQPVKNTRRWPERNLKSPGVKARPSRFAHITSLTSIDPLISSIAGHSSHNRENSHSGGGGGSGQSAPNSANSHVDLDSVSMVAKMSPSTPLTPPQSATHHQPPHSSSSHMSDPVFASVIIGGHSPATTPVHLATTNQRFFPLNQSPGSLTTAGGPLCSSSAAQTPNSSFSPCSSADFHLTPPPLPPRTNRHNSLQSPRNRLHYPRGHEMDESSPLSTSPPPLPPRAHSVSYTGNTITRSTSIPSYRDTPPPVPPLPHPSSISSGGHSLSPANHYPPSSLTFNHQRVNSDITSNGTPSPSPIVRRNSTLEPIPPRRYSHGNPPPALPSVPSSPLHNSTSGTPLTPPVSSTNNANNPTQAPPVPPPLPSPSSSSPGVNSGSPVPELPPKTYRLSNACR